MERPKRKAASEPHEFFPSDPPQDGQPHTLRSGEEDRPVLVDENGEVSSGVLLRPAGSGGPLQNHLFNVPMSRKTGEHGPPSSGRKARSRWVWLTVGGALLSFSAAVALQALSSSSHDAEEPRAQQVEETPRHSSIPLSTVATAVEMPRPLPPPVAKPSGAPVRHIAPPAQLSAQIQKPSSAAVPKWDSKTAARGELKNPFR
jgi:hypothetical protein